MTPTPDDLPAREPVETGSDNAWLRAKNAAVIETLNGLISSRQIERSELAQRLGWRPARLTRVLSGKESISIPSIAQIVAALGVDFDLVIRESATPDQASDPDDPDTPNWSQYLHPAGTFIGMTAGIAVIVHLLLQTFAAEAIPPFMGALLGAALFVLARSHWKLWLARREIRALKRYLKNRTTG